MLTTLKPAWPSKIYDEDIHLHLRDHNIENINPAGSNTFPLIKPVKGLQESRRIFLENLQNTTYHSLDVDDHRKKRKISFKVKNGGSNRRVISGNGTTTLSANKVQKLTNKFNELLIEEPKMAKVIRRVSNVKPVISPKPNKLEDRKKPSIKRKISVKKVKETSEDKHYVKAKVCATEQTQNSVKKTIEIFERRKSENAETKSNEKPKIPEKTVSKTKELVVRDGVKKFKILTSEKSNTNLTDLQNYFENKSLVSDAKKNCSKKDLYDSLKITKTTSSTHLLKMVSEEKQNQETVKPNNSFLWRSRSRDSTTFNIYTSIEYEDKEDVKHVEHLYEDTGQELEEEDLYDVVDTRITDEDKDKYERLLAKTDEILKNYKSNNLDNLSIHSYESFYNQNAENLEAPEEIYETLSLKTETKIIHKPLPRIPDNEPTFYNAETENIYSTLPSTPSGLDTPHPPPEIQVDKPSTPEEDIYAVVKDPYEKISTRNEHNRNCFNFEGVSLRGDDLSSCGSNRGSILSCDQQSNSLYGRYLPGSDHSSTDDWVDISDVEDESHGFVIIREKQKLNKKNSGWSNKVRDQWIKSPKKVAVLQEDALSDSNHYYESLDSDDDFDSFDGDSDDDSFTKINPNDSGVEMGLSQLPDPPSSANMSSGNIYGFTRLAARLRKNWSLTKNDISKSLSRMTKKKATVGDGNQRPPPPRPPPPLPGARPRPVSSPIDVEPKNVSYQNVEFSQNNTQEDGRNVKSSGSLSTMGRKKNWLKFRRTISMGEASAEDVQATNLQVFNSSSSTFYLSTEAAPEVEEKPQVPARRRALRPQSPPPPAPVGGPPVAKVNKEKLRSTSWYAECGLFKLTDQPLALPEVTTTNLPVHRSSTTCWYAEVGLYQPKSNISISSCSSVENSGNSSTKDVKSVKRVSVIPDLIPKSKFYTSANQDDVDIYYNLKNQNYSGSLRRPPVDKMATLLRDEPLYQFYDAAVAENAFNESSSDSEYDGYEEIGELAKLQEEDDKKSVKSVDKTVRTSVRNRFQGCRTLWCEIPEVIQSEILRTLTTTQRKLQEAKFEILTSEASYLNSLNVLTDHFIPKIHQDNLLSEEDQKTLFGNVFAVKQCSEKLLTDLESCWQESILLPNICNIIQKYSEEQFHVYVEYCANQSLSDGVLRKSRGDTSPKGGKSPNLSRFAEAVKRLEGSSVCQGLSLHSFLMLPMQRVTRLPLLMDAVLRRLTPSDDDFQSCQSALRSLHDLAARCNEAARHTERLTELHRLSRQLEFPSGVPVVDLVSEGSKRYLVRSGDLTQLLAKGGAKGEELGMKLTFGKRFTKQIVTVMLFEDLVVIAKRKSEDSYTVLHHCPRSFLELSPPDTPPPTMDSSLLLFLTLLENQDGKQISLLLSCSSETERTRWLEALSPTQAEDPNETIYESWDCPQVQAVHLYEPIQPDELSLKRGDVVNVDRKMKDGWFHGERLRDGRPGWFPGNHTVEIANPHVRARNLRQRYRLLAYTDEFLNSSQNKL